MTELEFLKQKNMVKVKSTSYLRYQIGDVELKFIKNSDEIILSIGEYSAPLNEFLAPFYDKNLPFSEKKSDGESLEEIGGADDTDIEEEIQRVLSAMKKLDLLEPSEIQAYRDLINILRQLKEIQTYI